MQEQQSSSQKPLVQDVGCVTEIAKIDLMNAANSWLKRQKRKLAKLEAMAERNQERQAKGEEPLAEDYVDMEWLEGFKLRLQNVEHAKDQIIFLPTCKGGKLI